MRDHERLGSAAIHILIGLGASERHGYSIMREVEVLSEGRVRLAPGTLYTNIKRLLAAGLIEESAGPDPALDDERRRYYRLTSDGRNVVAAEVDRMEALMARARPWLRKA